MRDFLDDDDLVLRPASGGFLQFCTKCFKVLLALAVVTILIAVFIPQFRKMEDIKRHTAMLDRQLTQEKRKLAQQSKQLDWLRNDPSYVEIIARDRLDMMRPGETIFRFDPTTGSAQ